MFAPVFDDFEILVFDGRSVDFRVGCARESFFFDRFRCLDALEFVLRGRIIVLMGCSFNFGLVRGAVPGVVAKRRIIFRAIIVAVIRIVFVIWTFRAYA